MSVLEDLSVWLNVHPPDMIVKLCTCLSVCVIFTA